MIEVIFHIFVWNGPKVRLVINSDARSFIAKNGIRKNTNKIDFNCQRCVFCTL